MKSGLNRLLILLAIFCATFLAVFVVRKVQNGGKISDILKGRSQSSQQGSASYTLQSKTPISSSEVSTLTSINQESAQLVHAVIPSVVSIDTAGVRHERRRDDWGRTWVQPRAIQGQGSGVIVTKEGHILTNYHVVKGTPNIKISMFDGSIRKASIIGAAPTVDIAVLKIDGPGPFTPLKFGDSKKTKVGNMVFAIGSPFGLGETVTNGIISAKKRSFSDSQVDLLQTSAAINPGNSGGPLVNIQGEIIGINSRIYSTDKKHPGFQGISFAIPSNAALKTLRHILDQGQVVRGFLGLALDKVNAAGRETLDYKQTGGVRIMGLAPDAPAMKAGLRKDDIIIQYNGHAITAPRQLIAYIQQSKIGSKVTVKIWRDKKEQTITANIGNAEQFNKRLLNQESSTAPAKINASAALKSIGLIVRDPTPAERTQGAQGVFIERILPESQLRGKLLTGDLIRAINSRVIQSKHDFFTRLVASLSMQATELIIQRGETQIKMTLKPTKKQ